MYIYVYKRLHTFENDKINEILKVDNKYNIDHIRYTVAYWKKFFPLHYWFVDNIKNGQDDMYNSHKVYIPPSKLYELKNLCEQIINNPERSFELLPSPDDHKYDDRYYEKIKYTYLTLEKILNEYGFKDSSFYYFSGW